MRNVEIKKWDQREREREREREGWDLIWEKAYLKFCLLFVVKYEAKRWVKGVS